MKILAVCVLIFAASVPAHADGMNVVDGVLLPDGSVVTSTQLVEQFDPLPFYIVDFTLPDATGSASGETDDVMGGTVNFNQPVIDVMFSWLGGVGTDVYAGSTVVASCPANVFNESNGCNGTVDLGSLLVSQLSWYSQFEGIAGIESLSYVVADTANVPEPSTLLLLVISLLLILFFLRKFGYTLAF
jgi:hypothetical protein